MRVLCVRSRFCFGLVALPFSAMRTFCDWKAHQSNDKVDLFFYGKHEGRMTVQTLPTLWQRAGAASPISVESGDSSVVVAAESAGSCGETMASAAVTVPRSPCPTKVSVPKEIPLRSKEQQVLSEQLTTVLDRLESSAGDQLPSRQRQVLVSLLVAGKLDLLQPELPKESVDKIRAAVLKAQALLQ